MKITPRYLEHIKAFFPALMLFFFTHANAAPGPVTPETALKTYLENGDDSFEWSLKEEFGVGSVKAYELKLTSQVWRDITWVHQLTILIPSNVRYSEALLFITGGSVRDGEPRWKGKDEELMLALSQVAEENQGIVAIVRQTPNQPLYDDLTEDALISYTFHNYKNDQDFNWPLLFPMVKSAVRAMDAVQIFSAQELNKKVDGFVVTGASKRGWTTWLTGSQDPRVKAIAPMVIDVLNMPVSLKYHIEAWDDYSIQIEDYVKLGIVKDIDDGESDDLTKMVDPYSYRKKLDMPKMLLLGTNDEYWPVDAVRNYIDEIPGRNLIHYVPNAGHGLGDGTQAMNALNAFFGTVLQDDPFPVCKEHLSLVNGHMDLVVKLSKKDKLVNAHLWMADSEDRDFRDEEWETKDLNISNVKEIKKEIDFPEKGFIAFYLAMEYEKPTGGTYTICTRAFVADDDEAFIDKK